MTQASTSVFIAVTKEGEDIGRKIGRKDDWKEGRLEGRLEDC
jgi:hypothetical protein